jgi:short-subunit dehydrogenase
MGRVLLRFRGIVLYSPAMNRKRPKSILITGASSGIGAALAACYAGAGVTLHLGGRDSTRLLAIAAQCRERGSDVHTRRQDVTDAAGMARWIEDAFAQAPIELVIANAGISGEANARAEPRDEGQACAADILTTNLSGVINTVYPSLDQMLAQPLAAVGTRGQIAIMSSIAGFRGMPTAPAYCASKAALRSFGEGLRPILAGKGIGISVICPGFVKSPMTDANDFPMPFLMSAERAARIIRDGLAKGRARITFPLRLAAGAWFMANLPRALSDRILMKVHRTPG